jgi:hypothetical protein
MGTIATVKSNAVFERDRFGQFAAECHRAAERTVQKTVKRGAAMSRKLAPAGGERKANYSKRPGYVPLKKSIKTKVAGTRGEWYSIAPHARFVEEGTSAHMIYGKLYFPWRGGTFVWNRRFFGPISGSASGPYSIASTRGYRNWDAGGAWVLHPGTDAQPFMRPAYEAVVKKQMMQIAKQEFPG